MKKITLLTAALALVFAATAQTNSAIEENFAAGVQTSSGGADRFHGDEISPERMLKYSQEGDRLKFECDKGFIDLSFNTPNIAHFSYYLSYKSRSNGWGINPSPKMVDVELKNAPKNRLLFKSSAITIQIDPITASLEYQNSDGHTFLKSAGVSLKPVTIHGEDAFRLSAAFEAADDESYYGLGQHQSGWMDHRGETVQLWHDYNSKDGEIIAVPFMLTNKGYAIVYDNPSRSVVTCGVDGLTEWQSEMGDVISYYVIYGETPDEIFKHYGDLCGYAPLPPKKALGYIQCKQRYKTQDELLEVARKYNEKEYPIDYMVVDWFHWKNFGDMSMDPKFWQDPTAMNKELKSMDINCMITCWPRFVSQSDNFALLDKNGWFMRNGDGTSMNGTAWDMRGAVIDATSPEASEWYWNTIRKNYVSLGFDAYWLDESEPDVIPHSYQLHEGLGARIYNLYPYYHAKGVYDGHRRDLDTRVFTLTRSSYLGGHQFGTTFWSSDIHPEWDVFKRQVSCGINVAASGMPYWSSDIGGWHGFDVERETPDVKLLITSDEGPWRMYKDYPEMYVRWFQYGVFCPTFRAHGTRTVNEVWSYGDEAETILVDFLKLRYNLLPYIYSAAWRVTTENRPLMRGLFFDYMQDGKVATIKDQYLFGSSIMVAPITAPGESSRQVYLPENSEWYNFWTNKKYSSGSEGKTIKIDAPIEQIPLLVKAGSIVPKANGMLRADTPISKLDIYIYPGADATYTHYEDGAEGYEYEKGEFSLIEMKWSDANRTLTIEKRQGSYKGEVENIEFNVVVVDGKDNSYNKPLEAGVKVAYNGTLKVVEL